MVIPGYRILSTLGKGGMATVYLAIQESFDRKVAIKVMSPQLATDPAFGDRFQREARIVSQMNHPNIVTVYDVGVVDNHHYLAMQYVEGKELRHHLPQLGLVEKIRIIKEIASALNYAGNKGYVHRDVKPDNVMLSDEDGRAILMDFGIAKTTADTNHSMTKTGTAIGTPYYMSPEQAQGKPVDRRTDIYSLGIMFFQMLAGRVPYDAESQVAIGIKHITEPIPPLPGFLQPFQPIIDKVMAKNPDDRYQTGAEFIKDLEKISTAEIERIESTAGDKAAVTDPNAVTAAGKAAEVPAANQTTVRAATKIPPAAAPAASNKTGLIAAAVVAVMLVLGGAWFFMQKKEPAPVPVAAVKPDQAAPVKPAETSAATPPAQPAVAAGSPPAAPDAAQSEKDKQEEAAREAARAEKNRQQALVSQQRQQQETARDEQQHQQAHAEIESRLAKADSLRSQGQFVGSDDNNAVAVYHSVLDIDPGNAKATQGIRDSEASYLSAIRRQIESGNIDAATAKMREANRLLPNNAGVSELLGLLQKKKDEQAAQKADSTRPRIAKLLVSDANFETMAESQKARRGPARFWPRKGSIRHTWTSCRWDCFSIAPW